MWCETHQESIPFVSGLVYNKPMAIKIEGNRVIVVSDMNVHHVTKKDSSLKENQMGECSICGEVFLYYYATTNGYVCSTANKKSAKKWKRKKIEEKIREENPYFVGGSVYNNTPMKGN
jgi:hypothetical protein